MWKSHKRRRKAKRSGDVVQCLPEDVSETPAESHICSTKRIIFNEDGEMQNLYAADNWEVCVILCSDVIFRSFLTVIAEQKNVQDTSPLQIYILNRDSRPQNVHPQTSKTLVLTQFQMLCQNFH